MQRTLINVIGAGRSGSTMLGAMLGRHSQAFYVGEVHAWFRPYQRAHKQPDWGGGYPHWEKILDLQEADFHAGVCDRLGVGVVVDSSKHLSWVLDNNFWARNTGLCVINLLLWKSPIDLAYSHWKRGAGKYRWRRVFLRYYKWVFQAGLPCAAIHYDDLIRDPQKVMQMICERIGLEYEAGMERFWEVQPTHIFGSAGTRKQMSQGYSEGIRVQEFDPRFESEIRPWLESKVIGDKPLANIIDMLECLDINNSILHCPHDKIKKPTWYYLQRLYRSIRTLSVSYGWP